MSKVIEQKFLVGVFVNRADYDYDIFKYQQIDRIVPPKILQFWQNTFWLTTCYI